jgi:hypothetical protein
MDRAGGASRRLLAACTAFLLSLAAACGCGASPAPENGDPFLLSLADRVDVSRVMGTIEYLCGEELGGRPAGSPQSAGVEEYLAGRLEELGLQPVAPLGISGYRQDFPVPAERCFLEEETRADQVVTASNILGMIPGEGEEMVILTANYDGIGKDPESGAVYPGADYNASGVGALMEVATVLSSLQEPPRRHVVFALLGAEECGSYGSSALASLLEEKGMRESARVINLEGLGAGDGDYMDVWDLNYRRNCETVRALEDAADLLGVTLELGGEDPGSSAGTFFLYHIPAVTCDWSWFNRDEHPDFHLTTDTPERINREGLRKATRVVSVAAWMLAG